MKAKKMRTFGKMHDDCNAAGEPCAYWGEHGDWYVAIGQTRDSGLLDQANFKATLRQLGGESETVAVERESHWACGWVEFILIAPAARDKLRIAVKIRDDMEDYPVVDEDLYSEMESEATWENVKAAVGYFVRHHDIEVDDVDELASRVDRWLGDYTNALENTDDQGGYPDDDEIEQALRALAGTDRKLRAALTAAGFEDIVEVRVDAEGQTFMFGLYRSQAPQMTL